MLNHEIHESHEKKQEEKATAQSADIADFRGLILIGVNRRNLRTKILF